MTFHANICSAGELGCVAESAPGNKKEMGVHPAQSMCTVGIMSNEIMDRPQDCKLQSLFHSLMEWLGGLRHA